MLCFVDTYVSLYSGNDYKCYSVVFVVIDLGH